jgi:hypothetical protein
MTLFSSVILLLNSCDLINPAEPVPSYIHLDSITLVTSYNLEGSALSNFSDAWVSVDGTYLGTYELPFTIPVIGEGSHKISVRPGILDNGISGIRKAYSKVSNFDTVISLQPNIINSLSGKVTYLQGTVFAQLEDFDDGSLTIVPTTSNSANFAITPASDQNALEGNSGHISLDASHPVFEYASSSVFVLPTTTPVYVELNYKCSQEFTIGVFVTSGSGIIQSPVLNLRPSAEWKKIYVNLSDGGGIFNNAINYKIYLGTTLISGLASAEIYLDNLKVLY